MHTKTQNSQSINRSGLWTEQGDNHHHSQTVYSIHCRILQHQLNPKPLRYKLQHAANTTKQCTENHHRLHQNISHRPHTSRNQNTKDQRSHGSKRSTILRRFKTDTSHPLHHTLYQPTETSETPHPQFPHTTRAS